jgi:hypothetical protein
MAIQRQTGKCKPTIRRWQARFMAEGCRRCCMKPHDGRQTAAAAGDDDGAGREGVVAVQPWWSPPAGR